MRCRQGGVPVKTVHPACDCDHGPGELFAGCLIPARRAMEVGDWTVWEIEICYQIPLTSF